MIINPSLHTIECISGNIGLDVETTGLSAWKDAIHSIAISTDNRLFVIDVSQYDHDALAKALGYMVKNCKVIAHNAKFDVGFMYGFFGILATDVFCTQLGAQIIANGKVGIRFNLLATLNHFLGVNTMETTHKKLMRERYINHKVGEQLTNEMLEYVASDVKYLLPLMRIQNKILKKEALDQVSTLENLLVPVLAKMEVDGCKINVDAWREAIKGWEEKEADIIMRLDEELLRLSKEFDVLRQPFYTGERISFNSVQYDLFGKEVVKKIESDKIQYSSQSQVINMLEDMGVDIPLKRVKDKEFDAMSDTAKAAVIKKKNSLFKKSVDEDSLTEYINENQDTELREFFLLLLDFRHNTKLLSTYGEQFLEKLDDNNSIHTQYTQCRALTGRLTSVGPNLQNIPPIVRGYFVPREGMTFITSDMNSAEVCIAADYSKEKMLLDSVLHGDDLHSKLASKTFSIIFEEDVTINNTDEKLVVRGHTFNKSKLRKAHKTVLFSKFYKGGASRIYGVLSYFINLFHSGSNRMKIARKISTAIDQDMPVLSNYLSGLIEKANKHGELRGTTLINRRRFFPPDAYGEAANFPIQNANAEAMKIALVNLYEYLEDTGEGRIVMTVHDEVVVETTPELAEKVGTKVASILGDALGMFLEDIEGKASINIGDHWEK